jgi:hypothetical protein
VSLQLEVLREQLLQHLLALLDVQFPVDAHVFDQIILNGLKKYGLVVADNGSPWYIIGAPDKRWNDDDLHKLTALKGSDFEAVDIADWQMLADSGRVDPMSVK